MDLVWFGKKDLKEESMRTVLSGDRKHCVARYFNEELMFELRRAIKAFFFNSKKYEVIKNITF